MKYDSFCRDLLAWYHANKREMPWRDNPDPYAVWVSEIMLQQTRIETVRGYFSRFMRRFPSFRELAKAPQQDVLKAWEGLGYYSRARNLQKAAQSIDALPVTLEDWRRLPGVGDYTAAAITSVCFGIHAPVVDGNVIRVLARYGCLKDDFKKTVNREKLVTFLQPFLDKVDEPGAFNQAMMELGETLCTPRSPQCERCPLSLSCKAFASQQQAEYPRKTEKKELPVRQALAFRAGLADGSFLFAYRPPEGLLGGLWELPNVSSTDRGTEKIARKAFSERTGLASERVCFVGTVTHVFTHFRLLFHVYDITGPFTKPTKDGLRFAVPSTLPLTTATRKSLRLTDEGKRKESTDKHDDNKKSKS